ncbi:MAG: 16S rRNA (cytidine(1402)-2'-O)-methyltransferase [Gammaproteobacteria bacterium]
MTRGFSENTFMQNTAGILYIVATPIGNLDDLTPRALHVLGGVNLIVAEDTRHSKKLLQHFNLQTPLRSLHEHNERARIAELLDLLYQGQQIAVISDAGTPLIRDPGYHLVHAAHENGIRVVPIPGACAAIAALSAAGLPADRFVFEGFLPAQSSARLRHLQELVTETRTLIFYETPHRIVAMLQDALNVFGAERHTVLAKELTKVFETIHAAPLGELLDWLQQDENRRRGEFVVLVAGAAESPALQQAALPTGQLLAILLAELSLKQAVKIASQITGLKKNYVYELALKQTSAER